MNEEMYVLVDLDRKELMFNELGADEDIMSYKDDMVLKEHLDCGDGKLIIMKLVAVE